MEKIQYYCDYCGKKCEHTDFIIPEQERCVEWIRDREGHKIQSFNRFDIVEKRVDICKTCQSAIARIIDLMRYANTHIDKVEEDVYISLKDIIKK